MEIPREFLNDRGERNITPRSFEPVERRGEWHKKSLLSAAHRAWHESKPAVAIEGNETRFARGLGWFSIALGLTELLAPRAIERFLGTQRHGLLLRIMGLREIASGVGILTASRPSDWLWARAGGDAMDIAALGMALSSERAHPVNIGFAGAAVAGIAVLDVRCAQELSRSNSATVRVRKSIQINRSPAELYKFWRNFQNLPKFMSNIESIDVINDIRSRWVVIGPAGKRLQWDAQIVEEQENKSIAWESLEGAQIENRGVVRFEPAPGGRGSFVRVRLEYSPPGRSFGAAVAKLFGRAPEQQLHEDLQHFKQIMEAGEVITTDGQPAGRPSATSWKYDQTIRRQKDSSSMVENSAA